MVAVRVWDEQRINRVAELLLDGKTARQIGEILSVSRYAIIGIVHRESKLRDIGFRAEHKHQERIREIAEAKAPKPKGKPGRPRKEVRVVSNDVNFLVKDWIARNGGARRFERGVSSDFTSVKMYLAERGHEVGGTPHGNQDKYTLRTGSGKPRACKWVDILALVDTYRRKEGKQPFLTERAA